MTCNLEVEGLFAFVLLLFLLTIAFKFSLKALEAARSQVSSLFLRKIFRFDPDNLLGLFLDSVLLYSRNLSHRSDTLFLDFFRHFISIIKIKS